MDKKYLIYGGVGAVVLIGGFFLLNRGGGGDADAPAADNGYYPATVYSSGGGGIQGDTAAAVGTTAATTDTSIAALIASQLSSAQLNADVTKFSATTEKEIALAGYANNLAITKEQSNASIMQGLASSLGQIVKTFQGSGSSSSVKQSNSNSSGFFGIGGGSSGSTETKSSSFVNAVHGVGGSIGYKEGVITLDVQQLYNPALNAANANIAAAANAAVH